MCPQAVGRKKLRQELSGLFIIYEAAEIRAHTELFGRVGWARTCAHKGLLLIAWAQVRAHLSLLSILWQRSCYGARQAGNEAIFSRCHKVARRRAACKIFHPNRCVHDIYSRSSSRAKRVSMPLHIPRTAFIGLTGNNSMRSPYCTTCISIPACRFIASRMCLGITT